MKKDAARAVSDNYRVITRLVSFEGRKAKAQRYQAESDQSHCAAISLIIPQSHYDRVALIQTAGSA